MTDKKTNDTDIDKILHTINNREEELRASMGALLDIYSGKDSEIFVNSAEMGGTESYVTSVSLDWFASKVRFAAQLPKFAEYVDPDNNVIELNVNTIENVLQRPLDWSRQAQLTQYLATTPRHKFPPVLVVISQPWVYDPNADEWDENGRAIKSSASFKAFDSHAKFGMLDVSEGMQIFAIDGQHRLLGVKGLKKLIDGETLYIKNKNGKDTTEKITVDILKSHYNNVDENHIQALGAETIGIEFISAVSEGETSEEARQRIRSIFVHVNKQAEKLKEGDLATLDEDSGFTIAARRVGSVHKLFDGRINWSDKQISKRSKNLTTLVSIAETSKNLLGGLFDNWHPIFKGVPSQRPEEIYLVYGQNILKAYFDRFMKLPSIERIIQGTEPKKIRNFTFEKDESDTGEANILFRPIGQEAISKAVGNILQRELQNSGYNIEEDHKENINDIYQKVNEILDKLFNKLNSFDKDGRFSMIEEPQSLWYGIFYDFRKKTIRVKGVKQAAELFEYLFVGDTDEDRRENLREEIAQVRLQDDNSYINFDGNTVQNTDIKLPSPL